MKANKAPENRKIEKQTAMKKTAVLMSSHIEVARRTVELLDWVFCASNNPQTEDLLKVTDTTGQVYWCDEIEFVNET